MGAGPPLLWGYTGEVGGGACTERDSALEGDGRVLPFLRLARRVAGCVRALATSLAAVHLPEGAPFLSLASRLLRAACHLAVSLKLDPNRIACTASKYAPACNASSAGCSFIRTI